MFSLSLRMNRLHESNTHEHASLPLFEVEHSEKLYLLHLLRLYTQNKQNSTFNSFTENK